MIAAQPSRQGVKLKHASGGSYQKPLKSFGDLTFATQYCTGFAINLSANSPPLSRFTSEDPIQFEGGNNFYSFVGNNPINRDDPYGEAYFAKRRLKPFPWLGIFSCNPLDNWLNDEIAHEQLFFEDGKQPSNIGFMGDGSLRPDAPGEKYHCKSGNYNDCIMRKAVDSVPLHPFCLLGKLGPKEKYNCQNWAEDVRREYDKLKNDPKIKKECECK